MPAAHETYNIIVSHASGCGGASPPEPAIPYFSNVRDVHISEPDRQNFFIVDEEMWSHSRPDLGDLRLYDGESQVQYALSEQRAGISSEEVAAKILNLGSVSGHTEFDLDTQDLAEYDRIRLRLDARDFVAKASVSGGSSAWEGDRRRTHAVNALRFQPGNSWARTRC